MRIAGFWRIMASDLPTGAASPESERKRVTRGRIALAIKAAISGGVLWFTLSRLDFHAVLETGARLDPAPIILAALALAASIAAAAVRWSLLTRRSAPIRVGEALSTTFAVQFAGNVLPSSLGQDAVRAFLSKRPARDFAEIVSIIFLDRLCGVIGLCILMVLSLPRLSELGKAAEGRDATLVSLGLAGAALAGALLIRHLPRPSGAPGFVVKLFDAARHAGILLTSRPGLVAIGFSILVQALVVLSIWLISQSVSDVRLSLLDTFATVPPAMFVSLMPISINGWGVREGAMVFSLGLAGVAGADALVISLAFGLLLIVVSLPGAFTLLLKAKS